MPKIVERLVSQLKAKGFDEHKARAVAASTMRKSGNTDESGHLTQKGKQRQEMGAAGRAKDRAAHYSGHHKPSDYTYSKKTNRATLKGRK